MGSQAQSTRARISHTHSIQQWKAVEVLSTGKRWSPLETRPLFSLIFLGAKVQVSHLQPLTLGLGEGSTVQSGVTWGEFGVVGFGKRQRGMASGFPVLGHTSIPWKLFFLKWESPSQGKQLPHPGGNHLPHPLESCSLTLASFFFLTVPQLAY